MRTTRAAKFLALLFQVVWCCYLTLEYKLFSESILNNLGDKLQDDNKHYSNIYFDVKLLDCIEKSLYH